MHFSSFCKEVVLLVVKAICFVVGEINQTASNLPPQDLWEFCFGVFLGIFCSFVFKQKIESNLTVTVGLRRKKHHLYSFENSGSGMLLLCSDQKERRGRSSKLKMPFGFQNKLVANRKMEFWIEGFPKWQNDLQASIFSISIVLALSGCCCLIAAQSSAWLDQ